MKTDIRLRDVMKAKLVFSDCNDTASDVAKRMLQEGVGSVLVQKNGNTLGIVTTKDLVRKALAADETDVPLHKIMKGPLLAMDAGADVYDAFVFMNAKKIRHLPLSDKGKIVGMVTMTDLLRLEPGILEVSHFAGWQKRS
jgi:signal-transduction protein with cAMP-binding, CBS, and nucleotidyltransferase domain